MLLLFTYEQRELRFPYACFLSATFLADLGLLALESHTPAEMHLPLVRWTAFVMVTDVFCHRSRPLSLLFLIERASLEAHCACATCH